MEKQLKELIRRKILDNPTIKQHFIKQTKASKELIVNKLYYRILEELVNSLDL